MTAYSMRRLAMSSLAGALSFTLIFTGTQVAHAEQPAPVAATSVAEQLSELPADFNTTTEESEEPSSAYESTTTSTTETDSESESGGGFFSALLDILSVLLPFLIPVAIVGVLATVVAPAVGAFLAPQPPAPAAAPAPAPARPVASGPIYNCDAARAAGIAPMYAWQSTYIRDLDRDGDGVACE